MGKDRCEAAESATLRMACLNCYNFYNMRGSVSTFTVNTLPLSYTLHWTLPPGSNFIFRALPTFLPCISTTYSSALYVTIFCAFNFFCILTNDSFVLVRLWYVLFRTSYLLLLLILLYRTFSYLSTHYLLNFQIF